MDLLLIGGVSGSGKSVALAALEDAGYYVVNNLPVPLIAATLVHLAQGQQQRVAIALDVKTGPGLPGLADAIAHARADRCPADVGFARRGCTSESPTQNIAAKIASARPR